jgi:enoyl-CoA hydratase
VSTAEVSFASEGPISFLTFNRPEARNALTWTMYDALADACEQVDADPRIRVFVIRAVGDAFAAGTDISQFTDFRSAADGIAYERRMEQVIGRLEQVTATTIAQVQGVAAGGGCIIALACDLRVCTVAARFGVPIARTLGNCLSVSNCARLVDLIGPARTKDLLITGRLMDAAEATAAGLITRLAEPDAIDEAVRDLANAIATHAPLTIRATKEALSRIARRRRLEDHDLDDLVGTCYASADFQEGVAGFVERRPPRFTGR